MFNIQVRAARASHTRLRQLADFPSVRAARAFILRLSFAYPSSHTRLRQLADFPSLILRLSFAQPSLRVYKNF
ncbi:hypothetical protein [Capnocytophaga bilenii]